MSKFLVLNVCVRNDDHQNHKQHYLKFFATSEQAIDHVKDAINYDGQHKFKENQIKALFDQGLWVWEWERRGNGDLYKIFEIENCDEFSFNLCSCSFEDSLTYENDDDE